MDGVNFKVEEGRPGHRRIRLRKIHHRAHHLKALGTHVRKDHFDGQDITGYSRQQMRSLRREMQMVFRIRSHPWTPDRTVSPLISEPIIEHKLLKTKSEIEKRTLQLMETVGLGSGTSTVYPHELDGAARESVGHRPRPGGTEADRVRRAVSALDVSIQAQI